MLKRKKTGKCGLKCKKIRMMPIWVSSSSDNIYHGIQDLLWPDSCLIFPDSSFCQSLPHTPCLNNIKQCAVSCIYLVVSHFSVSAHSSSSVWDTGVSLLHYFLILFTYIVQASAQTSPGYLP